MIPPMIPGVLIQIIVILLVAGILLISIWLVLVVASLLAIFS